MLWAEVAENLVSSILSEMLDASSQLSFGVYFDSPGLSFFVWQLADEKQVFRLLTFKMDHLSVCRPLSYVAALATALLVELSVRHHGKDSCGR
jgi:hypothetical protein